MAQIPEPRPEVMAPWPSLDSSSRRVSRRRLLNALSAALSSSRVGEPDSGVSIGAHDAREAPIEGVTSDLILSAGGGRLQALDREAATGLAERVESGVLVFMGAGDVTELAHRVAESLAGDAVGA